MFRRPLEFCLLVAIAALAGCDREEAAPAPVAAKPTAAAARPAGAAVAVESEYGTPVKDRVATIGLLNKRNNITQAIQIKPGEAKRVGNVMIKLASCEKTAPWEDPPETGAFVQVFVEERANTSEQLAWHKVFSGWLFRNSPSVNVVEHPVYDVWVKDCAMKFPGEEESVDPAASATSAAKPAGRATAAATASPSASASPSARPAATASADER